MAPAGVSLRLWPDGETPATSTPSSVSGACGLANASSWAHGPSDRWPPSLLSAPRSCLLRLHSVGGWVP